MKKITMILSMIAMVVFLTAPAFASSSAVSGGDTYYDVGSGYNVNGWDFGMGNSTAHVAPAMGNSFTAPGYPGAAAGAWTGQKVNSSACGIGWGTVDTYAFGMAGQNSYATAIGANSNWASGGQFSTAEYEAYQDGSYIVGTSHGRACTVGGTIAGAINFNRGNSNIGMAGAATGSMGNASAGNCGLCPDDRYVSTQVRGSGAVAHGSYASRGNGQAWTGGTAEYSYCNTGRHSVTGGGFAATGGISKVTTRPNGAITARSFSMSVSSNGPVNANGGTYISNLP